LKRATTHTVFGSKKRTKDGHRLRRYLKELDLVVLNPAKPTTKKGSSVLDFIICRASQKDKKFICFCDVLDDKDDELDQLGSDHHPVQLDLCFEDDNEFPEEVG
jgi:endonuclease/exonuclease/phosphatase family metal-dependent hydrolase